MTGAKYGLQRVFCGERTGPVRYCRSRRVFDRALRRLSSGMGEGWGLVVVLAVDGVIHTRTGDYYVPQGALVDEGYSLVSAAVSL